MKDKNGSHGTGINVDIRPASPDDPKYDTYQTLDKRYTGWEVWRQTMGTGRAVLALLVSLEKPPQCGGFAFIGYLPIARKISNSQRT